MKVDLEAMDKRALGAMDRTLERLGAYLRVPAISCDEAHHGDVRRLASMVAADLEALGFDAAVRTLPGALPLVTAERRAASPDARTLVIYGHLDLQPVAGEAWTSPPHEPTIRGERLYARGAADDMGGWVSHLAAIEAWLAEAGELPMHVKLVIESEEEIGSPNLERYMDAHPEAFEADVMVLTDCENPAVDLPGLTVSLRGLYEVEVRCEALTADVHSGLWGNVAPDVSTSLFKLLARLFDEDGRFVLGRQQVPAAFDARAREIPLGDEVVRAGAHLADGVAPLPDHGRSRAEWLWRQPAATVLSTTLPRPDAQKNALRASASATLSIRVAPGQTHAELRALLEDALRAPPGGVRVTLEEKTWRAESFLYEPSGPVFEAVDRAYEAAWGKPPVLVGVGGSIPFVALFGRRYSRLPLILNGVMDPETGAHGPDESLHLGVFRRAILANLRLLDELSRIPLA